MTELFSTFTASLINSNFLFCMSQGYPRALLPLTVAGIPSIHICLDFIPELLAQPQLEKQVNNPSRVPPTPPPPPPQLSRPLIFKAHANVHADFCDPAAVPVVYSVRLTQIPQCGQVSYQRYGDPPHRWMPFISFVYTLKVSFGLNKWCVSSQCWPVPSGTHFSCPSCPAWWASVRPSLRSMMM